MQQYFDTLTDDSGNALLGAIVLVTNYPAGTLASIYATNGTASPIPTAALAADITGQVSFFAPDGAYTLTYSYKGTVYKTRQPVQLLDPMGFVAATDIGGSANTYAVTGLQYPAQLYPGMKLELKAAHSNTGPSTLAFQGGSALPIVQPGGSGLVSGMIQANGLSRFEWDGTQFQLIGSQSQPFYAQTPAEAALSITPTNTSYPEGWANRYGAIANSTIADNSTALQNCILVCQRIGQDMQADPGTYRYATTLTITSSMVFGNNTIAGPRVYSDPGLRYGGIELIFVGTPLLANRFVSSSYAISVITGTVGSEGFARTRLKGLGIAWSGANAGGVFVQGAVDFAIDDCWLTGGLDNYNAGTLTGIPVYFADAIVSDVRRNTFRYCAYGLVSDSYFNENEIARNDFDHIYECGVVLRGKNSSSVRSTIRSNNFFGDNVLGMRHAVYISGASNNVMVAENTMELIREISVVTSNVDYFDAANYGTPSEIWVKRNALITTNGGAASAGIQLLANNCSAEQNTVTTPTGPMNALVSISSSASNVVIWGNDPSTVPLTSGDITKCIILDTPLFRTLPTDSSEATKSGWGVSNDGAIWWNETAKALRAFITNQIVCIGIWGSAATSANSATPSVLGINTLKFTNSTTVTVTNLTGGQEGQAVSLVQGNGNATTLQTGNFQLKGSTNAVMSATNNSLTLMRIGGTWVEIGRNF